MPDLLVFTGSVSSTLEAQLSELGEKNEYRVRSTFDLGLAKEWLATLPFDVVFVGPDISKEAIEELTSRLWNSNPAAPLIVVSPSEEEQDLARRKWEWCLLGADFVHGAEALNELEGVLQKIASKKLKSGLQFRILVVEDLESPRDIICSYVEHIGYPLVKGVGSGVEALEILNQSPGKYSCIITDINMPGMDGKALIEEVRKSPRLKHLPMIVLTAYGTVDNLMECLEVGASGFLVKPPSKSHLNRELSRALRIMYDGEDPRLTSPEEIQVLRDILTERGLA